MFDKKWFNWVLILIGILLILGLWPFWQSCQGGSCSKVNTWEKLLIFTGGAENNK